MPNPNPKPKLEPRLKPTPIPLDPTASPPDLKPLIADILRTRYCVPGSVFLVEAIERCRVPSPPPPLDDSVSGSNGKRHRRHHRPRAAVRLLLGDGELCIQALLRPEMHSFVGQGGSVFEGCYVRVDRFEIAWVELGGDGGGDGGGAGGDHGEGSGSKGEGEGGKRKMVYLVVRDLVTIGWDDGYVDMLRRERALEGGGDGEGLMRIEKGTEERAETVDIDVGGAVGGEDEEFRLEEDEYPDEVGGLEDDIHDLIQMEEELVQTAPALPPEPTKTDPANTLGASHKKPSSNEEAADDEPDYISDSDDSAFETLHTSPAKVEQRRVTFAATTPDPRQELQSAIIQQNQDHHPQPQPLPNPNPRQRPWLPSNPFEALKLTPLSAIPHLPYRQNWMVNVLAIVTSLSPVEPSHIGPTYRQRVARLADVSTGREKHVHLSVFLDPEDFTPRAGGVVLLMGVKNHLFDGGSLRKYVSDRPRGGGRWWVEDPERLGWCSGEVERLRGWWEGEVGGVVMRETCSERGRINEEGACVL